MPRGAVFIITAVMIVTSIVATWVWWQTYLNFKATKGTDLREYARNGLWRVTALWFAQHSVTTIGILSAAYRERPPVIRQINGVLLVLIAFSLVGVTFHEYNRVKWKVVEEITASKEGG